MNATAPTPDLDFPPRIPTGIRVFTTATTCSECDDPAINIRGLCARHNFTADADERAQLLAEIARDEDDHDPEDDDQGAEQ